MNLIFDKIVTDETNRKIAKRYEEYDNVCSIDIEHKDKDYEITAKVNVLNTVYKPKLILNETYDTVNYECPCRFCSDGSACAHIGVVILKLQQLSVDRIPFHYENDLFEIVMQDKRNSIEQKEKEKLAEMTAFGRELIHSFKVDYQASLERIVCQQHYEIEAFLNEEYGSHLSISFKIGNDRKYVISNISEFLNRLEHHVKHRYGKQLEMVHQMESFDEPSQRQIEFMREADRRHKAESLYYYSELKKTISLDNDNIDSFFDVFENQSGGNFSCQREDIRISLRWEEKENYDVLILMDDLRDYSFGEHHLYKIKSANRSFEVTRYCLDDKGYTAKLIKTLINQPLKIMKEERIDFFKYVLSDIMDYLDIANLFEFELKQVEKIKVFGDINDDGDMIVRVEYLYDDQTYCKGLQEGSMLSYEQDVVESYIRINASYIHDGSAVFEGHEERTLDFIEEGFVFLQQYADVYISENLKHFNEKKHYHVSIGVRYESDLLTLDLQSQDIPKHEISGILAQYKRKKKFYRLKSGELIHLDSPVLEELNHLVDSYRLDVKALADGKVQLNPYRLFSIEAEASESENIHFDRQQSFQDALDQFSQQNMEKMGIPKQYESILRDYQKEGIRWMKLLNRYHFNGILADDMGLGKTLQVIALIEDMKSDLPSIVVAPSSLVYNWLDEVHKFSKNLVTVCVVGNRKNRKELLEQNADLFITSYDYMRRDADLYESKEFHYVIIDEAQYIKNQKTQNALSVKKLKSRHRMALTGTPIENSLAELWSIFDFLMPGYLFNYHYFLNHYENDIVKNDDEIKKKKLKRLVEPFILRRRKQEVLKELPDKIEKVQLINFSEEEQKLYLAHLAQVNQELNAMTGGENDVNKVEILAMMTRLRQICCEPRLLFENIYHVSSKMRACMDLIINLKENNQKVLVFSSFTSVLNLLEKELNLLDISYYKLTGQTSKEERRELVHCFQNDDTSVFLISLKAGGTGLNLTSAQAVIHYDPWWNISAQNQATDRAYRIGQQKNVQVFSLVMKNSIEEKILKLQEKKKNLADSFVENSDGSISKMNRSDLMELFKM